MSMWVLIFIKMLRFSFVVARGANNFVFYTKNEVLTCSLLLGRPQEQKEEAFYAQDDFVMFFVAFGSPAGATT